MGLVVLFLAGWFERCWDRVLGELVELSVDESDPGLDVVVEAFGFVPA